MIDLAEYRKFTDYEDYSNPAKVLDWQTQPIKLKDGTKILVINYYKNCSHIYKYEYVLMEFGVVRILNPNGPVVDKSPLCEELDEIIKKGRY